MVLGVGRGDGADRDWDDRGRGGLEWVAMGWDADWNGAGIGMGIGMEMADRTIIPAAVYIGSG